MTPPVKVLFVCVENACRSQMAEAFARALGAGLLDVHSTGSAPAEAINPLTVELMAERGYDLSGCRPKSPEEVPHVPYEWVVTMGCGDWLLVPALHREDWPTANPRALPPAGFRAVRDEIEARVMDLVARARTWAEAQGLRVAEPEAELTEAAPAEAGPAA